MPKNLYKIYQLNKDVGAEYRFNTEGLKNNELSRKDYDCVYVGAMSDLFGNKNMSDEEKLDYIFEVFNLNRPADFKGHSLSVGDVIELDVDNWCSHSNSINFNPSEKVYCVDDFGFTLLPDFYLEEKKQWCEVYDLKSWGGKLHICELSADERLTNTFEFSNGYTMRLNGRESNGTARAELFNKKGELLNKTKDFSHYSGRVGDVVLENGERYIAWIVPAAPAHILAEQEIRHNTAVEATLVKFKEAEREAKRRQDELQRQKQQIPTAKKSKRDMDR